MARPVVLLTRALPDEWIASLRSHCELVVGPAQPAGAGALAPEIVYRLADADGILSLLTERIDEAVLAAAPRLRVVSNMAVGVDNLDIGACTRRGIAIGHTPGVLTEATADLTLALVLAWARRLPQAIEDAKAGRWTTWSPTGWLGMDLDGSTLGIVGFGKIGRAVARRARAFGMRVLVHTRSPADDPELQFVDRDTLLGASDIVSIHAPLDDATRGSFDAATLARMKATALLVNTARGPIVDRDALRAALQRGVIAGAALDVTDPEPLPPADPLYAMANVIVLPHIGSATVGTRKRMAELACANVLAGVRSEPLPHPLPSR